MKKVVTILIFSILSFSSCTTSSRMMSSAVSNLTLTPARDQFSILREVEGNGKSTSIFFIGGGYDKAENRAMYEAIASIPGADLLIAPRFEIRKNSFLFFYTTYHVKVKAKAIQLKISQ